MYCFAQTTRCIVSPSCLLIIIIIRQPLCPVVGRRPQHVVSKWPCLVLSSAISCRSSICPGRLFTAWLVSLVVLSCHMVSRGDARGPSVVFEEINMPCPGPFHFSHSVDYIYEFVLSLSQMLVLLSLYVMFSILLSILVCAAASLFCACLVSVQVSAPYVIAGSTQELYTCLQADGKVAFEDISVFGVCHPACHDSSLYLFVLVLFLDAVVLSQVHVAWDIFYQHIVHVYRGVGYNHHLCICDVQLKTHSSTFIG